MQIVGERLFHVEDAAIHFRLVGRQTIENLNHIFGLGDHAVKIGGEGRHIMLDGHGADSGEPLEIPCRIVATQFHF